MRDADEVLKDIATPRGFVVESESGVQGHTLHYLKCKEKTLLKVIEPPLFWPVRVTHYHADGSETEWARWGDDHDPNKPNDADGEPFHPLLDDDLKLTALIDKLLDSPDSKAIIKRASKSPA